MQHLSLLLCFISFLYVGDIYSQEMGNHQWVHRVLVISTDRMDNELYKAQVEDLRHSDIELLERKLIVYQVTGNKYRKGISGGEKWSEINNNDLMSIAKANTSGFEVILVGLDGGVKLRQSAVLAKEELFSIIDGMPMRKREVRKRNKNGG